MSCTFTQGDELLRYTTDLQWEGERVQALRQHVESCDHCQYELKGLIQVQEALIEAIVPQKAPESLDSAMAKRLASQGQSSAAIVPRSGLEVVRGESSSWQPTRFDGISMKPLSQDEGSDRMTLLLRMEPGAIYPPHRHEGIEECYMLEGTVISDGVLYHAGDYMRAAANSDHGVQTTETGCMMLLSRCTQDRVDSL